jgi:phosphohistidine phosphatase
MKLYAMRHAEAVDEAASGADEERRLTPRGRERTRDAADGLRALGLRFDAILTSPLARAAETAELIAAAYADNPAPQVLPALSPGVAVRELLAAIAGFSHDDEVLIVGHEPQLSRLVALLLTPDGTASIKLKKGACVALGLPRGCEPGGAELRWMATQRHLRKLRNA